MSRPLFAVSLLFLLFYVFYGVRPQMVTGSEPVEKPRKPRQQWLDILRGVAMVWMTVYHFCYDLRVTGLTDWDFWSDPFWTWQRTGILSLFLFCAGVGQSTAAQAGQSWQRFFSRWWEVVFCALLVSVATLLVYDVDRFIYFGVLHGMAAMLLLARCLVFSRVLCWLALLCTVVLYLLVPWLHEWGVLGEVLNQRGWNVLGLNTIKPITLDFVPLLPWFAVMLVGLLVQPKLSSLLSQSRVGSAAEAAAERRIRKPVGFRLLSWMGRNSLWFYVLHQPVMLGLIYAVACVDAWVPGVNLGMAMLLD